MSNKRSFQGIVLAMAILGLLASWAILFAITDMVTWSLAPFDTTPVEKRPAPGTWQREVSDFFAEPPGSAVLPVLVVGSSAILFLAALFRRHAPATARARLAFRFLESNLLIAGAIILSIYVFGALPLELAPYPGYGWTIKFLVPQTVLLILMFVLQGRYLRTLSPARAAR